MIWLFSEQIWFQFVPVLPRLQGGLAAQGWLGKLLIVEQNVAVQRGFQLPARTEVVALQHFLDPAVEALYHGVGLWMRRRGQTVPESYDRKLVTA